MGTPFQEPTVEQRNAVAQPPTLTSIMQEVSEITNEANDVRLGLGSLREQLTGESMQETAPEVGTESRCPGMLSGLEEMLCTLRQIVTQVQEHASIITTRCGGKGRVHGDAKAGR